MAEMKRKSLMDESTTTKVAAGPSKTGEKPSPVMLGIAIVAMCLGLLSLAWYFGAFDTVVGPKKTDYVAPPPALTEQQKQEQKKVDDRLEREAKTVPPVGS
jgi:hypothetical protein